jgi:hypothetical protein
MEEFEVEEIKVGFSFWSLSNFKFLDFAGVFLFWGKQIKTMHIHLASFEKSLTFM